MVEYKVPPGVDEYSSGNWLASVTRTRLDGIAWAWEHAWRAIGDADIVFFFKLFRSTIKHKLTKKEQKKILKLSICLIESIRFLFLFYFSNSLFTKFFYFILYRWIERERFFTSVLDDFRTQTKLSMNQASHFKPLTKQKLLVFMNIIRSGLSIKKLFYICVCYRDAISEEMTAVSISNQIFILNNIESSFLILFVYTML